MFLLNGNPISPDNAFTVDVSVEVNVPAVIETIDGVETITEAAKTLHVIDQMQYPANWLRLASPEERQAIGIIEVADPEPYDDRFYWGIDNPKQLEDETITPDDGDSYVQKGLKSTWIAQIKTTAGSLLAQTDWMVIRKAERSVDIPANTVTYRAAVVAEANRLETAIKAAKSMDAFIAVVSSQNWPV